MNFKRYVEASDTWIDSHYIKGTDTETITTLPATIYPLAQTATIGLKGNIAQSGTPSPSNPVDVNGCGERTANMLDADAWYGDYKQSDGTYQATKANFYQIKIKPFSADDIGKTFTFAMSISPVSGNVRVSGNIGGTIINGDSAARSAITFTVASVDDTIYLNYGSGGDAVITLSDIMLNTGPTARPFELYGYKIPISCGQQTETVYLGNTQSVRAVKKLVLDGTEDWTNISTGRVQINLSNQRRYVAPYCTHYKGVAKIQYSDMEYGEVNTSISGKLVFYDENYQTGSAFAAYLAQQYAAGTPVTVWYVLATEETGIVNEPLMKISTYSDSISGILLSVTAGANALDTSTTVKPSEVSANYSGWHPVTSAHERSGGAWD